MSTIKATVTVEIEASNGAVLVFTYQDVKVEQDNPLRWAFDSDFVVCAAASRVHKALVGALGSVDVEDYRR